MAKAKIAADQVSRIVELALLGMARPLSVADLLRVFGDNSGLGKKDIEQALQEVAANWQQRALELVKVSGGWRLRARGGYERYVKVMQQQSPPRLSRPMLEVLAIIAYNKGVTRGDIEKLRGVSASASQLAALEELGWIEITGRRETPGRPLVYATTGQFLEDVGIDSLDDLPALDEFEVADSAALADALPETASEQSAAAKNDDDNQQESGDRQQQ
ncbi:MAG: SMC-Scp complex subunit ScpB [Betaproteobacteria bacterium]|nr:SMC-Scp complex subunit ScpB [Betaproteobacteria bacterium]